MAKSGRYSAQRRKVEDVTASKTVTVADCGTYFTCGAATATLTLPTVAEAGPGWWAEFWVNDNTAATTITSPGTDLMYGFAQVQADNATYQIAAVAAGGETIVLTTSAVLGDFVRIWCDGTNYFWEGQSQILNGITFAAE
jgi:hypothetical protein